MTKPVTIKLPYRDWLALRARARAANRSIKGQAEWEIWGTPVRPEAPLPADETPFLKAPHKPKNTTHYARRNRHQSKN